MVYWRKLINKCRAPHHGDSGLSYRRQYHAQPAQTKDPASYEVVADWEGQNDEKNPKQTMRVIEVGVDAEARWVKKDVKSVFGYKQHAPG